MLRGRRAGLIQAEQRKAKIQRDLDRQLWAWTPRRIAAWTLLVLALVVAAQHLLAHSGWQPLPLSMGLQDFLVGYPMAGLLGIAGAMILEARSPRRP